MLGRSNDRQKYTVGMEEISAPIRIRIFVFSCCATRTGAATDFNRMTPKEAADRGGLFHFSANEQGDQDRGEQTVADELRNQHFNEKFGMACNHVPREKDSK